MQRENWLLKPIAAAERGAVRSPRWRAKEAEAAAEGNGKSHTLQELFAQRPSFLDGSGAAEARHVAGALRVGGWSGGSVSGRGAKGTLAHVTLAATGKALRWAAAQGPSLAKDRRDGKICFVR